MTDTETRRGTTPRSAPETRTWRDQAACFGHPETMYPETRTDGSGGAATDWEPARRICAGCPVTDACLTDAFATFDLYHGMRAGLTPPERRKARRDADPARLPHRTCRCGNRFIPKTSNGRHCSPACHAAWKCDSQLAARTPDIDDTRVSR